MPYYLYLHVACFPSTLAIEENQDMKYGDQRIYRTFEEFEREELRRADGMSSGMDDMLGELFAQELDFDFKSSRKAATEAATAVLRTTLDPNQTNDQKMAAVEVILDKYLSYSPGCTFDNNWCQAPEHQYGNGQFSCRDRKST